MFSFTASLILAASGTLAGPGDVDQAVEREFRNYRIQVYNTYRTWRSEYDRRRMAGDAAYAAWQNAGRQPQQATELIAWYRGAKWASLAHVNRPLPQLPEFPAPPPQAIAADPPPQAPLAQQESRAASPERYEIRRLEAGQSPRSTTQVAQQRQPPATRSPQPSWKSVSSAIYKGMIFGASRVVPK
jgi:hypothetical protein